MNFNKVKLTMIKNLNLKYKILSILFIPFAGMLYFSYVFIYDKILIQREMENIEIYASYSVSISSLIHEIQKERGFSSGFLGSNGQQFGQNLKEQRLLTDREIQNLTKTIESSAASIIPEISYFEFEKFTSSLGNLKEIRTSVDLLKINTKTEMEYYTFLTASLISMISELLHTNSDHQFISMINAHINALKIIENAGIERALLTDVFSSKTYPEDNSLRIQQLILEEKTYSNLFKSFATPEQYAFFSDNSTNENSIKVNEILKLALQNSPKALEIEPEYWFSLTTGKIDILRKVDFLISDDIMRMASEIRNKVNISAFIAISVTVIIVFVSSIVTIVLVNRIVIPLNVMVSTANSIYNGDLGKRIEINTGGEVALLANTINKMSDKLEKTIEDLRLNAQKLKISNEELEQYAYVTSHDLQEPLRKICSFSQLLANRYKGKIEEDADQMLDYIILGATRMQDLIINLLEYSRITTRGKSFEVISSEQSLNRAVENLQFPIEQKSAKVTYDPLPDVLADDVQLIQIFQNLISNSLKFSGNKTPEIHISCEDKGDEVVFSVADKGIGIEEEYKERIFVVFQRLHTQKDYPGTGIGLSIAKKIVERHGGSVSFESIPGEGTTFFFSLRKTAFREYSGV